MADTSPHAEAPRCGRSTCTRRENHSHPPAHDLVVTMGGRQVGTATNDNGVITMTITDPLASAVLRVGAAPLSVSFFPEPAEVEPLIAGHTLAEWRARTGLPLGEAGRG